MTIRTVQESDYPALVKLYKSFFTKHNIFQKSDEEIIDYLKQQKHELIVYDDNRIKGTLFLVNFDGNGHKLWKFRHFAFESEEIASKLWDDAEKKVKKSSETAKIELTIAENEKSLNFFRANGYEEEGKLKNHYRFGETCFILSKSFNQ